MDTVNTQAYPSLSEAESVLLEAALEEAHNIEPAETTEEKTKETLPTNSSTLLLDETSSRFSSAIWFSKITEKTVTLAGVGGIGSYVAFLLSRLKVYRLFLFDDDVVDLSNLSGQLFSISDVGTPKVSAINDFIRRYANYYDVSSRNTRVDSSYSGTKIMICGFDNMTARKDYFMAWESYVDSLPKEERSDCLFIDGRLAAEEFQVFCMKGDDAFLRTKYKEEWLFEDNEAEATLCSYKQTSFCANMIASVMVNLFVNFVANQCYPLIERDLPFFTYYDASRMAFKTEAV